MFTGLVEETGIIRKKTSPGGGLRFEVEASRVLEDLKAGDSICVNGACQTVEETSGERFSFFSIPETLERTNLRSLRLGERVNLERPLKPSDRLGGHVVSGHVDCAGEIVKRGEERGNVTFEVTYPREYERYLVPKGSIAVEGISLTVAEAGSGRFSVAVIPHTLKNTNLGERRAGDEVNLEFDQIAKYIEKQSQNGSAQAKLTRDFLEQAGWL